MNSQGKVYGCNLELEVLSSKCWRILIAVVDEFVTFSTITLRSCLIPMLNVSSSEFRVLFMEKSNLDKLI